VEWSTVGQIIQRVVSRRLSPERLSNLRRIGIDELSYGKRHRCLTIVVDHDRRCAVKAAEGRSARVSTTSDVLVSHGGAILVPVLAGALTATRSRGGKRRGLAAGDGPSQGLALAFGGGAGFRFASSCFSAFSALSVSWCLPSTLPEMALTITSSTPAFSATLMSNE
jgi:hypothetical protein